MQKIYDLSTTKNTDDQLLTGQTSKIGQSENCSLVVSKAEFILAAVPSAFPAICSKPGDPRIGGWMAEPAASVIKNLYPKRTHPLSQERLS